MKQWDIWTCDFAELRGWVHPPFMLSRSIEPPTA